MVLLYHSIEPHHAHETATCMLCRFYLVMNMLPEHSLDLGCCVVTLHLGALFTYAKFCGHKGFKTVLRYRLKSGLYRCGVDSSVETRR